MTANLPTPEQIDALIVSAKKHNIATLGRRMKQHIDRNQRGGSNTPDGHRTRSSGTESNGGSSDGDKATATEAAALKLIDGRTRDPLDHLAHKMARALIGLHDNTEVLARAIAAADELLQGTDDPEPCCQSCERITNPYGAAWYEPVRPEFIKADGTHTKTTVGGRLAEAVYLCGWCYKRVGVTGMLPTKAELRRHHGTVKDEAV